MSQKNEMEMKIRVTYKEFNDGKPFDQLKPNCEPELNLIIK